MPMSSVTVEEALPSLASRFGEPGAETRVEVLMDPISGRQAGLLVESPLERVVVARLDHREVLLEDVSRLRQTILHARARRGLLCVPEDVIVSNPVMLLATLSRIEMIRL